VIRILDRYVIRLFLQSYAVCLVFVLGLFVVIDFFQKIDDILAAPHLRSGRHTAILVVGEYYLLSLPIHFAAVAPFITLMAAMFAVTRLARQNELVSVIGAGVSVRRLLLPVFALAALLSVALIAEQQWLIPRVADAQRALHRILKGDDPGVLTSIDKFRDGRGNFIAIGRFVPARNRVEKLSATVTGTSPGRVVAEAAEYRHGAQGVGWYLESGERHVFRADGSFSVSSCSFFEDTDAEPRQIVLANADPLTLSFNDLAESARRRPDERRFRVLLYHHVTGLLLLLGLPFVLRRRIKSPFLSAAVCILVCGAYYATDLVFKDIATRGEMDPFIASFLPLAIFGAVGLALFDSVRS
jgi:lipopolysaccharide export system permease protein